MERFSLLLLEPGEIYFEDFSAFMYPWGVSEKEAEQKKMKGRLKICSKSIIFDPKEFELPILRFSFREITSIEKWVGPLLASKDTKERMILLTSEQTIYMKESNVIAPYRFKKEDKKYLFTLIYSSTEDFLPQACQLHRASTLPVADQNAMINAIVIHRQNRVSFDTSWLENLYEKIILEVQGDRITPLVTNPGRILLTNTRLYFQPFNNVDPVPVRKIKLLEITRLVKRRYLLRQIGLEVYCKETAACSHLYLSFNNETDRNDLYERIMEQELCLEELGQENMTLRWQNRVISNFEYLSYLNSLADRSLNDLTQYPVFPWVISDFTSQSLDLSNPDTYRDLTKPIGALNKDRLFKLLERFRDMPEPKFLYGSHYSTPGYVLYYIVRTAPELMLCLQNGRFDQPDRMFNSMDDTWNNCLTSYSDFKELIPEFYEGDGEFLRNTQNINFGSRQDGRPVGDVGLPPWASSPADFIAKMRSALESDHVSESLHQWIDLIFGHKQNGDQAENSSNLFYYLTYEGAVDLESIKDRNERAAMEQQIMEFGQTPRQLFTSPHPKRTGGEGAGGEGRGEVEETGENANESDATPVENHSQPTFKSWDSMVDVKEKCKHQLHKEGVTSVQCEGKLVYSVSQDGLLKVYNTEDKQQQRSVTLSNMALSTLMFLPDKKLVLVGSWDNNVYTYSMEYGRLVDTLYAHDDAVSSMAIHENLLHTASWDSTVKVFEGTKSSRGSADQYVLKVELEHDSSVMCVHVCEDGSMIASGTKDGHVCLWETESYQLTMQHRGHIGTVNAVQFSPDGQRLISCGDDGYLKVMDLPTGTEIFSKNASQALMCLCWDGRHVLTGGQLGDLLVWDLVKVQIMSTRRTHSGAINCISVNNGNVVTGGNDRAVHVLS